MKRILILGAGGSPATNFVRSLRDAPEEFYLVGTDCNKFYMIRSETDTNHLIPPCSDEKYIDILNKIIDEEKIEFLHVQNDAEMEVISDNREKLNVKYFLPSRPVINICLDKLESNAYWKKYDVPQPITIEINNKRDLRRAFKEIGGKLWIRERSGAGGRGSLPVTNYKQAKNWIDFKEGWGKFIAAEYLSPETITWQSIWNKGQLVVAQTRKRLYWELGKISPSGVSGATGGAITTLDKRVDDVALKAIFAVNSYERPHGIFSVDMTYNKNGMPIPTEINIGRFFTTHYFFTQAGLNMPYIFVKLAFDEKYPEPEKKFNPLPDNLLWIRGMDFLPILTKYEE